MPLPGNKASTPFKNMDIKTALLSAGNRKRKAPPSPVHKNESKSLKLSTDLSDHENDMEILGEDCGITVTLEQRELDANLGDCKENKDINATEVDTSVSECKGNKDVTATEVGSLVPDCIENKQIPAKLDFSPHVNKTSSSVSKQGSPKSSQSNVDSDSDAEQSCEKSKTSDISSCDELDTSVNVSLNTSGLGISGEDENDKGCNSKSNNSCSEKTGEKTTKEDSKKVKKKKMTPAEALKRAEEREQKQKERMLKKQELESKKRERMLERERKIREKQIQKEREEFERKERERIKQEKKEQEEKEKLQKQKEREEKLKLKQIIQECKLEEKKRKEEMKLKKEEELKKAEEERLKAKLEKEQKEKEKQERAKAAFAKFFVKPNSNSSAVPTQTAEKKVAFLPFQISDDMTLAPVVPLAAQERFDKNQLDHYLKCQDTQERYLQILKSGSYKDVRHRKKNRKLEAAETDVIVIDKNDQAELGLRPKLLQFHQNVRPPYWGTWRKKSKSIRPRNPFGEDEIFDYSVDSDDEWDEGGPGESLSGTEAEDESEDDYELDNEFLVPHGYLSDEEAKKEDDDEEEVNDPEKKKTLLKRKLLEFETERKKKTTEVKPVILGCYFVNNPAFQDNGLQLFLRGFAVEMLSDTPIPTNFTVKSQQGGSNSNKNESPKSSNSNSIKKKKLLLVLPEEAFPQLIRLVHGNTNNKRIIAEEFQKFWLEQPAKDEVREETNEPASETGEVVMKELASEQLSYSFTISLKLLKQTIREIASYGKSPDSTFNKYCWWVHEEVREKYGLMDIPLPNRWKYVSLKEPEPPAKVNCASIKEFLSHN